MCSKLHLQDMGPCVNHKLMLMNDVHNCKDVNCALGDVITRQETFEPQIQLISIRIGKCWGATVLKCIPGVKFPKCIYTLIHFNTPGNIFCFSAKKLNEIGSNFTSQGSQWTRKTRKTRKIRKIQNQNKTRKKQKTDSRLEKI